MKNKRKIISTIIAILIGFTVILICDMTNLFTKLGLHTGRIDTSMWEGIVSIVIALLSYHFVDGVGVKKNKNAEDNAIVVLKILYGRFIKELSKLSNPETSAGLIDQLDGSIYLDDKIYDGYINTYSTEYNEVEVYAQNGVIDKKTFEKYKEIKVGFERIASTVLSQPYLNNVRSLKYDELVSQIESELNRFGVLDDSIKKIITDTKKMMEEDSMRETVEERAQKIGKELDKYMYDGKDIIFDVEYPSKHINEQP